MRERDFQRRLIGMLHDRFPGCIVLKNDANYMQGIPDLIVLFGKYWAALECKESMSASRQPNQAFYVESMDRMSYARFVCPENVVEVLDGIQEAFGL